jgi:Carboxypeptidase regulatory-like domain
VDGAQQPIVNARVTLACWQGRECAENPERTRTDSQGDFEFKNVRSGRYVLSVEREGFFPRTNVPFVVVGGLESSYSFSLTPCPNSDCTVKLDPGNVKVIVCE